MDFDFGRLLSDRFVREAPPFLRELPLSAVMERYYRWLVRVADRPDMLRAIDRGGGLDLLARLPLAGLPDPARN
jgi:hypothetical protein